MSVAVRRPLAVVQWSALLGCLGVLVWSIPGLIVNPDFATGDSATAVRVLGVDMNGWHAVSGFLVVIPVLWGVAAGPRMAAWLSVAAAGSLLATAVWALMARSVAGGLFSFPHQEADALLHVGTASIFLAGAANYFFAERGRG